MGPGEGPLRRVTLLHWVLRIAVAAEYIGHGAFGLMTKPAWLPYLAVAGIGENEAYPLMQAIGALDILLGLSILFVPTRAALLYMTVWGLWTALLRPLAGESAWEAVERAGNYGVPLALLMTAGRAHSIRGLFAVIAPGAAPGERVLPVAWVLRLTAAALLIGHGVLAAVEHKAIFWQHYASVGLDALAGRFGVPVEAFAAGIGWFECVLGAAVLGAPVGALLLFVLIWKVATESLYITAGYPVWEFVERAGSYGAPLALWLLGARVGGGGPMDPAADGCKGLGAARE